MKARNSLAIRNFFAELTRRTNDHSAMFTFTIWSRFSPPEFPNVWSAVSFCSYHASVLHKSSFLCLKRGKLPPGLAGTIQAQIVDEEWQKPQQIEESYRFPAEITWRVNLSSNALTKNSSHRFVQVTCAKIGAWKVFGP